MFMGGQGGFFMQFTPRCLFEGLAKFLPAARKRP